MRPCVDRNLESNALIGIEICEFQTKLKNWEFHNKSSFWLSLGTIWIDSVLFEVVPPILLFHFFDGNVKVKIGAEISKILDAARAVSRNRQALLPESSSIPLRRGRFGAKRIDRNRIL